MGKNVQCAWQHGRSACPALQRAMLIGGTIDGVAWCAAARSMRQAANRSVAHSLRHAATCRYIRKVSGPVVVADHMAGASMVRCPAMQQHLRHVQRQLCA